MNNKISKFGLEIDDSVITRINELFFDRYAPGYENHPEGHGDEIFVLEVPRYKRFLKRFKDELFGQGNKRFVDMATGTGFIPSQLRPFLGPTDTLVCVDLSEKMLNECKGNLSRDPLPAKVEYKKTDGVSIPVPDASVDVLTVNSSLHHIPRTDAFLKEAERALKPGGILIIGHESNASFQHNRVLWFIYRVFYMLYHPAALREKFAKKIWGNAKKALTISPAEAEMAKYLNEELMKEGLLSTPLSKHQLDLLVEIHSNEGFDINEINRNLPNCELFYRETYNHLWWIYLQHYKNPILAFLNYILAFIYPADGKTMLLAYKKAR